MEGKLRTLVQINVYSFKRNYLNKGIVRKRQREMYAPEIVKEESIGEGRGILGTLIAGNVH